MHKIKQMTFINYICYYLKQTNNYHVIQADDHIRQSSLHWI